MSLEDPGTEARRVEAVRMRDEGVVVTRLAALLADEDWRVRKQAAEAAASHLAEASVLSLLVDALVQPDDVGLRNAAVEAFSSPAPALRPEVAGALGEALGRAPRTARKFVCAALVGGGAEAVPILARISADEDVMTACAAVEALTAVARSGVASVEIADHLLTALARPEPVLRLAAIDGLVASGSVIDASALRMVLADPVTGAPALGLLARARGEESVELLLGALVRPHTTVDAALALARRGEPSSEGARARLSTVVSELTEPARRKLLEAIGARPAADGRALATLLLTAGELRALPAVVELGARVELDPECRAALVALGEPAVAPLLELASRLATEDVVSASWALELASDLAALDPAASPSGASGAQVAEVARALLAQGEDVAAKAAAGALALWGGPSDAQRLAERARPRGSVLEAVVTRAIDAIAARAPRGSVPRERGGRRSVPPGEPLASQELRAALASDDPEARAGALDALADLDDEERVELATMALTDEDESVQIAALRALARVRGPGREEAVRSSRVQLRREQPSIRAEALRTLSQLGAFEGEGPAAELTLHLSDPSPQVLIAALRAVALAALAGPSVEAALERVLSHPDPEVVKEALSSLERHGDDGAIARVTACLSHPHWSVRVRAAEVLALVAPTAPQARAALAARRDLEPDELVRRAIDAGLVGGTAMP